MSNFAKVIKEEISRVARKEQRDASLSIKKASASHRSDIAALKRRVAALELMIKKLSRAGAISSSAQKSSAHQSADGDGEVKLRFSAARLRAQRERQGLSAPALAKVIGVSAQTVYNWETGKGRPRPAQLAAIAKSRKLSKAELKALQES